MDEIALGEAHTVDASWAAAAIGDVPIELSIEIARRTLSLGELWRLRPGDVLELMAPIAAEVTLLAGGVPIARGSLVDVEGALGVRVESLEVRHGARD